MIRIGIIGGAGYVAGELLRLLVRHPEAEIVFVRSGSHAGEPVTRVHGDLLGETELRFIGDYPSDEEIDLLFLCGGHSASRPFLEEHPVSNRTRIIDVGSDFRLKGTDRFGDRRFIYGLPELYREEIREAENIANPGCFATAIQLALLPLASTGLLEKPIHVNAVTGATGAGAGLSPTTHFAWREGNVSIYKPFTHQHLGEIRQGLEAARPGFSAPLHFIPVRGNFTRGIFATAYTECPVGENELGDIYRAYYADHPFTIPTVSAIDNLLKGAAGQAVQNMNLMFGLQETLGLRLKASAF